MVDRSSEGFKAKPFPVLVEEGKVIEFAESLGTDNPEFFKGADGVCPPTFLTNSFFWERRVEGADAMVAVAPNPATAMHAEQEYTFFGPPPAPGTKLEAQTRVDRIWDKQSKSGRVLVFVDIITDFRDETGALVAEGKMTIVEPEA